MYKFGGFLGEDFGESYALNLTVAGHMRKWYGGPFLSTLYYVFIHASMIHTQYGLCLNGYIINLYKYLEKEAKYKKI